MKGKPATDLSFFRLKILRTVYMVAGSVVYTQFRRLFQSFQGFVCNCKIQFFLTHFYLILVFKSYNGKIRVLLRFIDFNISK